MYLGIKWCNFFTYPFGSHTQETSQGIYTMYDALLNVFYNNYYKSFRPGFIGNRMTERKHCAIIRHGSVNESCPLPQRARDPVDLKIQPWVLRFIRTLYPMIK